MPQSCNKSNELKAFLDEELATNLAAEVTRHVESCTSCQTELEQLTQDQWTRAADHSIEDSNPSMIALIDRLTDSPPVVPAPNQDSIDDIVFPSPPGPDAPLGRLGPFRILAKIASGSQGVLFRAFDESLSRNVAIKVLSNSFGGSRLATDRMIREARAAAALRDERIVQIYQIVNQGDFPPFLVMEFVEGGSLKDRLERLPPLSHRESVKIIRDAALGLVASHRAGLVHRDIKPSNILLNDHSHHAQLTDFGLALDESEAIRKTAEGMIAGTPAYMSPEQISRPESVDYRSDIYSLGVVFYELLAGEVPFRGVVRMTLHQVVHDEPRPPRFFNDRIPRDLETICLRAMSKSMTGRLTSAQELVDELDRWLNNQPIKSRPVSRLYRAWRWCRRNPVVTILGLSVAILLLTLTSVSIFSARRLSAISVQATNHAYAATQQRDAALETLSKLVFELQEGFERDEIDLDLLQQDTLRIALEGLKKFRRTASSDNSSNLQTGTALWRLGEVFSRLEQDTDARDCLQESESFLRSYLVQEPDDPRAIQALISVLWTLDDLETNNSGTQTFPRIGEADRLARKLLTIDQSDTATFFGAKAAFYRGEELYFEEEILTALPLLEESQKKFALLFHADESISAEAREYGLAGRELIAKSFLELNDETKAQQVLIEAVKLAEQFVQIAPADLRMIRLRLTMYDQLARLSRVIEDAEQAERSQSRFDQLVAELIDQAISDASKFVDVVEMFSDLGDHRIVLEDYEGAFEFAQQRRKIIQAWLSSLPDDEYGRLALAWCFSDLASLGIELELPPQQSLEQFQKSHQMFHELGEENLLDDVDWQIYIESLVEEVELRGDLGETDLASMVFAIRNELKIARQFFPNLPKDWVDKIDDQLDGMGKN